MSTEEEKEELRLQEKYAQNSLFGMFLDQASIYVWMAEVAMKFGNVPNTIITIPRRTSSRSVMDKVMEFNRCMDLKLEDYNEEDWKEENIVAQFKIDELHENKTIEITIGELEKELSDGTFDGDTDSIWRSEMMQNPCPSHEEIEKAGDGPLEVGRQMHDAIARTMRLSRRDNACPAYVSKKRREVIEEECCAVCEMVLDEPGNFPTNFPDKWKICCYCSEVWGRFNGFRGEEYIHIGYNWKELKERWEKHGKKFKEVFEL